MNFSEESNVLLPFFINNVKDFSYDEENDNNKLWEHRAMCASTYLLFHFHHFLHFLCIPVLCVDDNGRDHLSGTVFYLYVL